MPAISDLYEKFDGFKSDFNDFKTEVRDSIRASSETTLTEVRERMARQEADTNLYRTHTNELLREIRDLALSTNGRVNEHENILAGGKTGAGLVNRVDALTTWRTAMVSAGGIIAFFAWWGWMAWGGPLMANGIINRPEIEYLEFIDARIHQWIPDAKKPAETHRPLGAKNEPNQN